MSDVRIKGETFTSDPGKAGDLFGYLRDVGDDIPDSEWQEIRQALVMADNGEDGNFDLRINDYDNKYWVRKNSDGSYYVMPG